MTTITTRYLHYCITVGPAAEKEKTPGDSPMASSSLKEEQGKCPCLTEYQSGLRFTRKQCGQRMEYSMEFSSIHVFNGMEWCYY